MTQGRKTSFAVSLTAEEQRTLEEWQRSTTVRSGLAKRGRIILMLADGNPVSEISRAAGIRRRSIYKWVKRFNKKRIEGLKDKNGRGRKPFFRPEAAVHLVRIACQRPDNLGRSLSQWDCTELADNLIEDGIVTSISADTVRRILEKNELKPWRHHMWLSPKFPRDKVFYDQTASLVGLYTRPCSSDEIILSVDEKTSLQPRPRKNATKPAHQGNIPNYVEHEYSRDGALNLFGAFNIHTGEVFGQCHNRKRQKEFIEFLESVEQRTPSRIQRIHIICDNAKTHKGKEVKKWLKKHLRFRFHFTPVHSSWLNQIEQWFSILQRKRLRIADFPSKAAMAEKIMQFISQWNGKAHPFNWTTKSVVKIMAKSPYTIAI